MYDIIKLLFSLVYVLKYHSLQVISDLVNSVLYRYIYLYIFSKGPIIIYCLFVEGFSDCIHHSSPSKTISR